MFTYIIQRVLIMIPTLFVISVVTFIIQLPPGDHISNENERLKGESDTAAIEKLIFLRAVFGLDKPLPEQYAIWLGVWPGSQRFSGLL